MQGRKRCAGAVSVEREKQKSVCMCLLLLEMRIFKADTAGQNLQYTGKPKEKGKRRAEQQRIRAGRKIKKAAGGQDAEQSFL